MKPKVTLFVNGGILCKAYFATTTESDFNNVTTHANPDDFDLSEAIVVDGDVEVGSMDIKSHKIACTQAVTALGENYTEIKKLDKE